MDESESFRAELRQIFSAALAGADAGAAVARALPAKSLGRVFVVGAGKAAAAMAEAVERTWGPQQGLVVTQQGYGRALASVRCIEASHPLPGLEAQAAAAEVLLRAAMMEADETLLVLLSGGGSALWPAPHRGLSLEAKRALTTALLKSGATIAEINTVRRHLSRIKGGGLARACKTGRVIALAVSDVPGDDPAVIASGPVSADATTQADALAILSRYGIEPGAEARIILTHADLETAKPGAPCFARVDYRIVLRPAEVLEAAAHQARTLGYEPVMLGDAIEGEAQSIGAAHAQTALARQTEGRRIALISGGELTVTIKGDGMGGPNHEYALGAALALQGAKAIAVLAADSDGQDGAPGAAGAFVFPDTLARAARLNMEASDFLNRNDSGAFFSSLGDDIVTGPTHTNVNDVRVILIRPES